ncbi:sugar MFS transporter [Chryseolinea soli]|uniref:Sugar MFS transporter n=1 Tax=Chryseolinea soli TaxID=2321403 RepID=A0A385SJL6_9BACT|nr:sugar MFS transporter [Chryseolinea soli]AYB31943.1 sugar MFS transporter [Chryseolinea soli]
MHFTSDAPATIQPQKDSYLIPLTLVTSLFFLWGLAYGLLDVLNKHFQDTLNITTSRSTFLQMAYFGAYFLVALPAGIFTHRFGYKTGIIAGLLLYTGGTFLFYPAAEWVSFEFFVLAMFVLASGLAFLETTANAYITVLGDSKSSEFRLNLSQCFNGIGAFLGPILAATFFFGEKSAGSGLDAVKMVYIMIGAVVFLIAVVFSFTHLPEIAPAHTIAEEDTHSRNPLFARRHFRNAVITQFFYVAAQVGIAALFINYCTETITTIDNAQASYLLSIGLLLFTVGRFVGTALMKRIAPNTLLFTYALLAILLTGIALLAFGWLSVYALVGTFFFLSIMFPTIFALGIKDLGPDTKRGSAFIIMSIAGGAFIPYIMGTIADHYSTASSYAVPTLCLTVVAWYGWNGHKAN